MFKKSGRGALKPFCVNESCVNFLPEDKRGYPKRKSAASAEEGKPADKKPAAKKPAAKKTAAKKSAAKKPAAKKTGTRKSAKTKE